MLYFALVMREHLAAKLAEIVGVDLDTAMRLVRPTLSLVPRRAAPEDLRIGATRSGGLVDLPPGFSWPRNGDQTLAHFLQIDLASLPAIEGLPLPQDGLLSFFYDTEDLTAGLTRVGRPGWLVTWFPPGTTLESRAIPEDLWAYWRWAPLGFDLHPHLSIPPSECYEAEGMRLSSDQGSAYFDLREEFGAALGEEFWGHRMGGWWSDGQNEPRSDAERATRSDTDDEFYDRERSKLITRDDLQRWLLLLELRSVDDLAGTWVSIGDADKACFMITRRALEELAFVATRPIWVY